MHAVIFDMDNTLIYSEPLKPIRDSHNYDELTKENLNKASVYKPVIDFLNHLHSNNIPMAIVTNSGRIYADRLLSHFGLKDYFKAVITYSDVKHEGKKPSPTGINLAISQLGLTKEDKIIYIGDEDTDIVAAYRANVIPALACWGSRESVSTTPQIEISSSMLKDFISQSDDFMLFADRCAIYSSTKFKRSKAYFVPLDIYGNIVTVTSEMRILCLGRYFSKNTITTSIIHDSHNLSKEIAKKEDAPDSYSVPEYWIDMIEAVLCHAQEFKHIKYDLITVIPAKSGKSKRLEKLIEAIRKRAPKELAHIKFLPSIFNFADDARSVKHLKAHDRNIELERSLRINEHLADEIVGKSVLVIDDVITTGSTFKKGFSLLEEFGAISTFGLAIAKTVTIYEDEKDCPKCGSKMFIRKNKTHDTLHFFCSGYHDADKNCKYIENVENKSCPNCGRNMNIFMNRYDKSKFWSCSGYKESPACNHKENYKKSIN